MSWVQPSPPPTSVPEVELVDVRFGPNVSQRRWTVVIRLILAVPHLVVLAVLGIVTAALVVIGWFGALFTGRLPGFVIQFASGYLRWSIRVTAYLYLLTDAYPPFSMDEVPAYPVHLSIRTGPLNRWAVLFRLFLAIPAYVVDWVLAGGAWVVAVAAWVVTLILGRLPVPFAQAFGVVARFQARYAGYWFMLSAEYPWWGLFGDEPAAVPPPGYYPSPTAQPTAPPPGALTPSPVPGAPPPPPGAVSREVPASERWAVGEEPAEEEGGESLLADAGSTEGSSIPSQTEIGAPEPPLPAAAWRLPLEAGGKVVLIVMIVIGVLAGVVGAVADSGGAGNPATTASTARGQTISAYDTLAGAVGHFGNVVQGCNTLSCAKNAAAQAAGELRSFGTTIGGIEYPTQAVGDAQALQNRATNTGAVFTQMSRAPTVFAYQSDLDQARIGLNGLDAAYRRLVGHLDSLT